MKPDFESTCDSDLGVIIHLKIEPMVRIINYSQRVSDDGKTFFSLEVQGGIETIKSRTGNLYVTARKASIPSTFNEETCKALIGSELEGRVEKQQCSPYAYEIKETGETIELAHQYVFVPENIEETRPSQQFIKPSLKEFSVNEELEPSM